MPRASTVIFDHPFRGIRRRELKAFLADVTSRLCKGEVTCLVTTDAELRRLNRTFRKKDYPTDVLSFPSGPEAGELAISLDRAQVQAQELGHTLEEELRILILHGALHLTGMDHESDRGEMAAAETRWRKRLKLPAGLIERAQA
jgi:probable rRNA maturation factor